MSLFGKKKLTVEEILEGLAALSPEEKEKVKASMQEASAEPAKAEEPAPSRRNKTPLGTVFS